MKSIFLLPLLFVLGGCTSTSHFVDEVHDVERAVKDRRNSHTVKTFNVMPPGAVDLGTVEVWRCEKDFLRQYEIEPQLSADLRLAAYRRGGNSMAEVQLSRKLAFGEKCLHVLAGTARAFKR